MKKKIILTMTLLLAFGLVTGCGKKKETEQGKEPEVKVNTNENVVKDQNIEGISFTNTALVVTNGVSRLTATVTNNTGKDYTLDEYAITAYDKDGNVIITIPGYIGEVIKNGESKNLDSSVDIDLTNASSITYTVKK